MRISARSSLFVPALLALALLCACEAHRREPAGSSSHGAISPAVIASVAPASSSHALPPDPPRAAAPVKVARPPLRWMHTPGGGGAWLAYAAPSYENDAPDGAIHSIGTNVAAVGDLTKGSALVALSFSAADACVLAPALTRARDQVSLDVDNMSPLTPGAVACLRAVRPRALSFTSNARRGPLPAAEIELLTHLDDCEAFSVEFAGDEVARLLGARAGSADGAALRSLCLPMSHLTADGVRALSKRRDLRSIGLRGLGGGGQGRGTHEASGLDAFGALPDLERVDFSYTDVSDSDLAAFAQASALRWLMLESTSIGDAGVAHLAGLSELEYLNLSFTNVGDAGVSALSGLRHLRELDLVRTQVTDRALDVLAQLPELRVVSLDLTPVTDAGLEKLARLPALRDLRLPSTITPAAFEQWKRAHPDVRAYREQ